MTEVTSAYLLTSVKDLKQDPFPVALPTVHVGTKGGKL